MNVATKGLLGVALVGAASAWAIDSAHLATPGAIQTAADAAGPAASPQVAAAAAAGVVTWAVDYASSTIGFASTVAGAPMQGAFARWDAQIAFDPERLSESRVAVTVDIASVATGDDAPDSLLPGPDWFDTARFPHATFTAASFRALSRGRYEADGELSIRGIKRQTVLPFTLGIDGETATMQSELTLRRSDFALGSGQWQATDVVPALVTVRIALKARRSPEVQRAGGGFGEAATLAVAQTACSYGAYWGDDYRPKPAFAGQTRAPAAPPSSYTVETLADLDTAWSLEPLPDGRLLVTERPGRLRIIDRSGKVGRPIAGLPPIKVIANAGLYDVALDPDFASNRRLYFGYFAPAPNENPARETDRARWAAWTHLPPAEREAKRIGMHRIATARLSPDGTQLENVEVLAAEAGLDGRIAVGPDGRLYVTAGTIAAGDMEVDDLPQQLGLTYGKVLRINKDGTIPRDNPFVSRRDARPEIFAYGLRDPQGAAFNPATGELWTIEHGPRGGDELNIIRSGRNYGFPTIGYGRNYSGAMINDGATVQAGLEQPIYFWTPSIAPSGMHFYTGSLFPAWQGNLFIGAMAGKRLIRLVLDGDRVVAEEQMLIELCEPIRDIAQGPEGALYLLTKGPQSKLLRLTPGAPARSGGA